MGRFFATVRDILLTGKWVRRFDWGLLLALVIGLIAAAPFLTRPGLPRRTDAELHVYRAAELGHALREGVFYPRWAPNLYYGYGYPIFNYYAPLTYYLANLFDLLPGVDVVEGTKVVFVLGLLLASLGAYLLGRELFSPAAGVLAAASFTLAPYIVYIDPYARGDLAEYFAICLMPLVFLAFRRVLSGAGGRGALLGCVLALAALVLSHALLGLVSACLLLAYWAWEIAFGRARARAGWGALAFALAAALIAFYWLPFLFERDAIKLRVVGPGHFDFHEHFLFLGELLAPSRILDMGATAPRYRHNLGLAQWLLALPALGVLLRLGIRKVLGRVSPSAPDSFAPAPSILYFVLSTLGLIFLMLPASTALWELVPGMPYFQFPWRLLGPANLMLAVCAAAGTTLLPTGRWRSPALALGLAAILLLALPALYPRMWSPDFGGTSPLDIIEWEKESLALGTTSTGDFLPVKAALVPMHPESSLVESYSRPGPVDKVNRASLPESVRVDIVEHGPLHDRLAVSTHKLFVLRLYTFYFPGWRAYVDGQEVEIELGAPEGFITLWVPEGEHEVLVRFEDTPPRTAGWVVTGAGLVVLGVALALIRPVQSPVLRPAISSLRAPAWLGGALVLFVVLKSAVIDPQDNWLRYTSPPGQAWAAQHELRANFGGQIEFLGYDLPRSRVRSGEEFSVTLYWHALAPLGENYQSFVHLARPPNIIWGQQDKWNPGGLPTGGLPTTRWPLDKYVWDEYRIRILPGTPPGEYTLNAGIPSWSGGYRLLVRDEEGQVTGDSVAVASVEVLRPARQPRPDELDMTGEVMAVFPEGGVTLLGYAQDRGQVAQPGELRVTLFWRADRDHPSVRVRDLVLLDAGGREVRRVSGAPLDGAYPFEVWRSGEVVRDQFHLVFVEVESAGPESLDAGVYRFGATVSADAPLSPEGVREAFVPLGVVEIGVE